MGQPSYCGFQAPHDEARITQSENIALVAVIGGSLLLSGALSIALLMTAPASGEERGENWFELYHAKRGTTDFRPSLRFGPFPEPICYSVGALAIDELNRKHPDKDFLGRCDQGDLLTLRELADRAAAMIEPKL